MSQEEQQAQAQQPQNGQPPAPAQPPAQPPETSQTDEQEKQTDALTPNTWRLALVMGVVLIAVLSISLFTFFRLQSNSVEQQMPGSLTELTVVASLPLGVSVGQSIANAITLAFEEIDYKVGVYTIELVILDDSDATGAWSADLEGQNAVTAASDLHVVAYLGPYNSGAAKVSMPILNRAGILQISPGNTWPGLTKPGFAPGEPGIFYPTGIRHYFRVVPTDDLQAPAGAAWARDLGFTSVFILDDGETYGKGIADLFRVAAENVGLNVVGQVTLKKDGSNTAQLIEDINTFAPGLVYYGGVTPNGITDFVKTLRETSSSTVAIMGPDGIQEQDFVDRIGAEAAEGIYATTVGVPTSAFDSDRARQFEEAYIARYEEEPEVFGAYGYESARVVIQAIQLADQANRAGILEAVRAFPRFSGVFGSWSFDRQGDTSLKLISGHVVRDGKFEFVDQLLIP